MEPACPTTDELPALDPWRLIQNAESLPGADMPLPYRDLLVHEQDMTSTLERFHGEPLGLRVLARQLRGEVLERRVVLVGKRSQRPVEVGAIRIYLAAFADLPRRAILDGLRPLGSILAHWAVPYLSRPQGFFRVQADAATAAALELAAGGSEASLYGRRNELADPRGPLLAEVVEILPPLARLGLP